MAIKVNKINQDYGDKSSSYASNKGAWIGFANSAIDKRFVIFKIFLKDFSFDRAMSIDEIKDLGNPWTFKDVVGTIDQDTYKVTFDVVSANLSEAFSNHWKLQQLYRLAQHVNTQREVKQSPEKKKVVPKTAATTPTPPVAPNPLEGDLDHDGNVSDAERKQYKRWKKRTKSSSKAIRSTAEVAANTNDTGKENKEQAKDETIDAKTVVYLSNLISNHHSSGAGMSQNFTRNQIVSYGLDGTISDLTYAPIMEMGFFESGGRIFAKAFTMSFEFHMDQVSVNNNFYQDVKSKTFKTRSADKRRMFGVNSEGLSSILKNKGD